MNSLLIENGRLVDPSQQHDRVARLLIIDGTVKAIDPSDGELPKDTQRLDASGRIVAPGLVDLSTELREPGRDEDETIASGSQAALAGGYTSILCSSNTHPPIDTPGAVEFVRQKAAKAHAARIYVTGCVSKQRRGEELAELGLLVEAGAVAFSDSPAPLANSALVKRALEYCRMFDRPIFDRPEVPELAGRGVMHEGRESLVLGLNGLPTEAEDLAVARDVRLAEATGGRLHVGPVSTMGSIDLIRRVKSRGIKVTASVCPHNLSMTDEQLRSFDARFKVHPPLRSERHVEMLRAAVSDGTIDAIQTGHMPRALEKKMDDLDLAPFGMTSLETSLAAVATTMLHSDHLDWSTLIQRMSTAPAAIAGIPGGSLAVGQSGDVILIDPERSWTVDVNAFHSRCSSTPLAGSQLQGQVTHAIVGGEIRYVR
ncbi:dihydroorotase [Roseimaritima ulvae]|uniref:Dihydroorotase n=1 Tax=Roseimaritima ulvae TaxID=980254 RepID=A0A5B9QUU8_9BACT|nr:dihydroorotase [Roseimaritima ulvae]QEG42804.1 Dihydroorotase [Roseimaritima ulvae]